MFKESDGAAGPIRTLLWWEARRVPFNVVVALYGSICLAIFHWAITTSGRLGSGEDAVEPMMLLVAPVVINAFYTLGWIAELMLRRMQPSLPSRFAPALLKAGLATGMVGMTLPAAVWVAIRFA